MRMKIVIFLIVIIYQYSTIESIKQQQKQDNHESFEILKIEKVNAFFNEFKSELNKQDLKKFYKKLYSLVIECEQLVRASAVVSNKDISNFLDSGLVLIHKKFQLHANVDDFLQKFKMNEADFVLHHNVIDEETIKSNDWYSKDRPLNQNENEIVTIDSDLSNVEFTAQKLRKNMVKVKKNQQILNKMDDLSHEIHQGHNVLFFDKEDLDD